jgi:hypothetical protein
LITYANPFGTDRAFAGRVEGGIRMKRTILGYALILAMGMSTSLARAQTPLPDLDKFFREVVGLNMSQIDQIHHGRAIATVLTSPTPDQVMVFGTIHVESSPDKYLQLANDFDALRKLPGYLAIQTFSEPPQLSDLREFTIPADDLKELKGCKPGDCDVQLPSGAMQQFQKSVNWAKSDAATQANELARQLALEAILAYQKGGNAALGEYRDKEHPASIANSFQSLVGQLKALPVYLPEVNRLLLDYPNVEMRNAQSAFYWENVNFGLKPTLRMVQQITYKGGTASNPAYAVVLKQLYASHYFQSALDLTVCVRDPARSNERGFYLITVKGSQQAGLTGMKGSIVRKVAVGKSRSSVENTLTALKQKLEADSR